MELETYIDRYGFNPAEFTKTFIRRIKQFSAMQRTEILLAIGELEDAEYELLTGKKAETLPIQPSSPWAEAREAQAQAQQAKVDASPDKQAAMDLMVEARENLRLAKVLRDTAFNPEDDSILSSIGDASKTLLSIDKLIDSASKRFQVIYSQSTQAAMEEAVKDVLRDMDQETFDRFILSLEEKLANIQ